MKMNLYSCFIVIIILSINVAVADYGGMGSGGGKALVCFDSEYVADHVRNNDGTIPSSLLGRITHLETFDLYYSKIVNGPKHVMTADKDESYHMFFNRIMEKIQEKGPFFARDILKSRKTLNDRIISFKNAPVDQTFDENYTGEMLLDVCSMTNIAVQKWDESVKGFRMHIDMRLFTHELFSEESKAILLLHEYLYFIARNKGETNSKSTRVLISAIMSEDPQVDLRSSIANFQYE
ncbi:MAG: hypothetical protein KAQ98_05780 [Bacteriovoracaceae bacterium]|nr:hypothetical protein [Bacteriovoracaceae bacterium]